MPLPDDMLGRDHEVFKPQRIRTVGSTADGDPVVEVTMKNSQGQHITTVEPVSRETRRDMIELAQEHERIPLKPA